MAIIHILSHQKCIKILHGDTTTRLAWNNAGLWNLLLDVQCLLKNRKVSMHNFLP